MRLKWSKVTEMTSVNCWCSWIDASRSVSDTEWREDDRYSKEQLIQRLEMTHICIFIKTDGRIAIGTNIVD